MRERSGADEFLIDEVILFSKRRKMDRTQCRNYIEETYNAMGEKLFAKYPSFLVFRHERNRLYC